LQFGIHVYSNFVECNADTTAQSHQASAKSMGLGVSNTVDGRLFGL
jgi:hypothetical protein